MKRSTAEWSMGLPPSQISNPCSFIEARAFFHCVEVWLTIYCKSRPLWVMACYNGDPPCSSNHSSDGTVGEKWDKLALGSNYTGLVSWLSWYGRNKKQKAMKETELKELPPKHSDPGGNQNKTVKCKSKSSRLWC